MTKTREIRLTDIDLEKVKGNPALITETMAAGQVPQIHTVHADANTTSCMAAEQLVSEGRRFHEVYVSPQDTPENLQRKARDIKDDEAVILVRHQNEYVEETMKAVWDFMFRYQDRLVVIILKKEGRKNG